MRTRTYLPVPRGVPIADATLNFDARYTKDEPGRTNLVLWADGVPLAAQNIADGNGPVLRNLPLEQRLRSTGFLRLGVDWQSEIALRRCESNRATANALTISPQTRLSYRYDASAIGNLDDAWSTLPGKPVLLVSDTKLDQQVYDSAWRMGVAMQRAGKRVDVRPSRRRRRDRHARPADSRGPRAGARVRRRGGQRAAQAGLGRGDRRAAGAGRASRHRRRRNRQPGAARQAQCGARCAADRTGLGPGRRRRVQVLAPGTRAAGRRRHGRQGSPSRADGPSVRDRGGAGRRRARRACSMRRGVASWCRARYRCRPPRRPSPSRAMACA